MERSPEGSLLVTGLGAVSPIGLGTTAYCRALRTGESGVSLVGFRAPEDLPYMRSTVAAACRGFDARTVADAADLERLPRLVPMALAAAAFFPDRVVAAASFHGGRLVTGSKDSPHLLAPHLKARVYVAGAVEDPSFTDEDKKQLQEAFAGAGVDHTVLTYEGAQHGFVPSDHPSHHPAAAERHWTALLQLLGGTLKA